MKDDVISKEVINYLYMSVCKTLKNVPFSNRYWVEQIMMGPAQYILEEYMDELQFTSKKPAAVCITFLNFLESKGFLISKDYQMEELGNDLLVHVKRDKCNYRKYCLQTPVEGLLFYCVRVGTFQAVLQKILGKSYSASMETDQCGVCHGKLSPAPNPIEEIVNRDGDVLKIAGRRAILLSKQTFASLLMSIKEHAPHTLKHVLYDAGYRSGALLARKTRDSHPDQEESLQVLLNEIKNIGWGRVELVSFNPSQGRASLRCYDSFQAAIVAEYGSFYRSPQVNCDFLRGLFAAFVSIVLNEEIICEEMNCQSVGGDYCEFLAMPLPKNLLGKEKPSDRRID
ncbi:MAG: 4-vinyl reductase [Desulfotomaculaceae bacterium]|nr:4-vinyl reductase [Desulfotomaculaceae bacterium]